MKRAFDVAVAFIALVLLAPAFALVALLIKWDSPGPVFFRQERVGLGMRRFTLYKFRTMRQMPPGTSTLQLTVENDRRITRVGAPLRRTKVDELPQLLNVVRGDMSLVGPRPEVPKYVDMFRDDFEVITRTRPGITDPASVHYRNESALLQQAPDPEREYVERVLPDKIRRAKNYAAQATFASDVLVILETLMRTAVRGDGSATRWRAARRS